MVEKLASKFYVHKLEDNTHTIEITVKELMKKATAKRWEKAERYEGIVIKVADKFAFVKNNEGEYYISKNELNKIKDINIFDRIAFNLVESYDNVKKENTFNAVNIERI